MLLVFLGICLTILLSSFTFRHKMTHRVSSGTEIFTNILHTTCLAVQNIQCHLMQAHMHPSLLLHTPENVKTVTELASMVVANSDETSAVYSHLSRANNVHRHSHN